ncbi:MAG: acyl-CoA dehydrogenase [Dehalococcoidia bacterium]|nr:MAG: acyl-CoA dehydrogenase [Dehalococcoidia bacterium]
MDFRFTPQEEAFRQEVHDFIEKECPADLRGGGVNIMEEVGNLFAWRAKLAKRNWIAPAWPKEYGGAGMSIMEQFIYNQETARMRAPPHIFIGGLGVAVVGPTIIHYGSEEQKKEFIPKILSGEHMWCQGFSEPEAGSDLASLKTRAVRDGDDYVINGQKIWTTVAHVSHYMLMLARTDPDAPKHKGISYFVVPMKTPGITVRPLLNMPGVREFNEVFLEDARIPANCLLGEENRGWYMAATPLAIERSNIGSAVGQQQNVEDLVQFARENQDNGIVRLGWDPALRYELAERYIETEAAMMLSYRVVTMQAKELIPNYESAAVKLYSTEMVQRIANTGLRLLGLYGQLARGSKWAPLKGRLEYQYLRSIGSTIEAGTSEIQRNTMATRGLGLPRGD